MDAMTLFGFPVTVYPSMCCFREVLSLTNTDDWCWLDILALLAYTYELAQEAECPHLRVTDNHGIAVDY